jgi:copper chaperone CopZ
MSLKELALIVLLLLGAAWAAEAYLRVDKMKAASCATEVADTLKSINGVEDVEVSHENGLAWVKFSKAGLKAETLASKISAIGHPAKLIAKAEASRIMDAAAGGQKKTPDDRSSSRNLAPWEPVHATFAGCAGGCGMHGENARAVIQPGAKIGQLTYCPVSGVVFEITRTTPSAQVDGRSLYFCCEGCARHFAIAKDDVLAARNILGRK